MIAGALDSERRTFANRILAALPGHESSRLEAHLHPVTFTRRGVWLRHTQRPATVLFPDSGVLSATVALPAGAALDVGMVGVDGVVGGQLAFDGRGLPWDVHVQIPGRGHALPLDVFVTKMDRRETLWTHVMRFTRDEVRQLGVLALCNHYHTVQQRCARWLLMALDRLDTADVPVTHDVLAAALGGHRPTVSLALETLQNGGAVSCQRSVVRVVDRRALEDYGCGCYQFLKL